MLDRVITLLSKRGISPYIWTILCILPFYFIFQSSSTVAIIVGVFLTVLFFVFYRFAFISKGWLVYVWSGILISISVASTILFSYIYFAFFLAYFVSLRKQHTTFFVLYAVLLLSTTVSIYVSVIRLDPLFLQQLPLVVIVWISVILLPFTIRNRKELGQLEEKLEDANKKIAELVIIEERERIARDLHDTLGQRLALIGLKSDLARRLVMKRPEEAQKEIQEVQQTARTALNEVRKLVSSMRAIRLKDEILLVKQLLQAAEIRYVGPEEVKLSNVPLLIENLLSMCLKEAVTNVVKHSGASECHILIEQSWKEITIVIQDNGIFKKDIDFVMQGHGLLGMKERLEFVNGSLELHTDGKTTLVIKVPNDVKQAKKEG